ncbi:PTS system mannose/fructose/N-acetylgalactosamine-transporter subunit IIB [Coprothermobacter proteolyticus]|uniref:PTS system mannose/fructose/N-acetylgalactosamine-transporter subunit IIB n=1 Tax=Coprothermobacter proteolyticus TaxID=35786 RepID=UPI000D3208D0|nr:PTS sugar transporter subunit IIB [Coprothermobacter proteolyticus]
MKLHLHIDNRLIHGQVTVTWCSFYGANMIVVVNDKVAVDPIQKIMLPQAARGLPTKVLGVKEAVDYLKTLENQSGAALVIAKTPQDALGLLDGGLKFESVNVGNQAPVPGTKPVMVFPWIAATPEDAQTYQKIAAYGYRITPKRTPADRDIDLVEELKKKKLLV